MESNFRVLVADDEWEKIRHAFVKLGAAHGIHFDGLGGPDAFDLGKVLESLGGDGAAYDVLLLDIIHAGHERAGQEEAGIRLFKQLGADKIWQQTFAGSVQIVFFSSDASARREYAVACCKRIDAAGFLSKAELLKGDPRAIAILRGAAREALLYRTHPELRTPEVSGLRLESDLIYSPNSLAMHRVWRSILAAARCWEPIFISGQTGTGKELVAKAIYRVAKRIQPLPKVGAGKFFPVNIGAMPSEGNMQYVELFGAHPGAYTGGGKDYRKGVFEWASGGNGEPPGTVFLDELGDASPLVQTSLLRVLQESTVTPLGAGIGETFEKTVEFRLISASHRLIERVGKEFREDLYHRIMALHIVMPPLCERLDDVGVLVHKFVNDLNKRYAGHLQPVVEVESDVIERLRGYHWPGNVRQLERAVVASYVTSSGGRLRLAEHVEAMLSEERRPTGDVNVETIIASLPEQPRSWTTLEKDFNATVAQAVVRALIDRHGGHLQDSTAKYYFGNDATAVALRRWAGRHNINSPKVATRRRQRT